MSKTDEPPNYSQATQANAVPQTQPAQQTQYWNQPVQQPYPVIMQPQQGYPQAYNMPQQPMVQGGNVVFMGGSSSHINTSTPPNDYMVMSILVTVFCSLILGLIAVYNVSEGRKAWARGDISTAHRCSSTARKINIVAIIAGIVLNTVTIVALVYYINTIGRSYTYYRTG